ncbi:hypothetical protein HDE_05238 [Halotydeus destructor]|nr:hypothetical protein HDE_05238 [Halotydeus destructor]
MTEVNQEMDVSHDLQDADQGLMQTSTGEVATTSLSVAGGEEEDSVSTQMVLHPQTFELNGESIVLQQGHDPNTGEVVFLLQDENGQHIAVPPESLPGLLQMSGDVDKMISLPVSSEHEHVPVTSSDMMAVNLESLAEIADSALNIPVSATASIADTSVVQAVETPKMSVSDQIIGESNTNTEDQSLASDVSQQDPSASEERMNLGTETSLNNETNAEIPTSLGNTNGSNIGNLMGISEDDNNIVIMTTGADGSPTEINLADLVNSGATLVETPEGYVQCSMPQEAEQEQGISEGDSAAEQAILQAAQAALAEGTLTEGQIIQTEANGHMLTYAVTSTSNGLELTQINLNQAKPPSPKKPAVKPVRMRPVAPAGETLLIGARNTTPTIVQRSTVSPIKKKLPMKSTVGASSNQVETSQINSNRANSSSLTSTPSSLLTASAPGPSQLASSRRTYSKKNIVWLNPEQPTTESKPINTTSHVADKTVKNDQPISSKPVNEGTSNPPTPVPSPVKAPLSETLNPTGKVAKTSLNQRPISKPLNQDAPKKPLPLNSDIVAKIAGKVVSNDKVPKDVTTIEEKPAPKLAVEPESLMTNNDINIETVKPSDELVAIVPKEEAESKEIIEEPVAEKSGETADKVELSEPMEKVDSKADEMENKHVATPIPKKRGRPPKTPKPVAQAIVEEDPEAVKVPTPVAAPERSRRVKKDQPAEILEKTTESVDVDEPKVEQPEPVVEPKDVETPTPKRKGRPPKRKRTKSDVSVIDSTEAKVEPENAEIVPKETQVSESLPVDQDATETPAVPERVETPQEEVTEKTPVSRGRGRPPKRKPTPVNKPDVDENQVKIEEEVLDIPSRPRRSVRKDSLSETETPKLESAAEDSEMLEASEERKNKRVGFKFSEESSDETPVAKKPRVGRPPKTPIPPPRAKSTTPKLTPSILKANSTPTPIDRKAYAASSPRTPIVKSYGEYDEEAERKSLHDSILSLADSRTPEQKYDYSEYDCSFRVRQQTSATFTPRGTEGSYACQKCGYRTSRINNLVLHHKDQCPYVKNMAMLYWENEIRKQMKLPAREGESAQSTPKKDAGDASESSIVDEEGRSAPEPTFEMPAKSDAEATSKTKSNVGVFGSDDDEPVLPSAATDEAESVTA